MAVSSIGKQKTILDRETGKMTTIAEDTSGRTLNSLQKMKDDASLRTSKQPTTSDTTASGYIGTPKTSTVQGTGFMDSIRARNNKAPDYIGTPNMRSNPIAGSQASGTLKGETSNTAFGNGLTGDIDTDPNREGIDNQAGFDRTDTSPTQNILEGIGTEGYGAFFTEIVKGLGYEDKNIDPLFASEMKSKYESLFAQAAGDPDKIEQLKTSLANSIGQIVGSQEALNNLDYDRNAILSQFENGDAVADKIEKMNDLIDNGVTDPERLATMMGMTTDDILRAQQGDYTGFGAELTGPMKDEISEDIELAMTRAEEDEKRNEEILNRRLDNQMADELEALNRAERSAEITESNMSKLAGITGIGYSSLGTKGIAEVHQQTKDMMDDIKKNYGRAQQQTKDALAKLATDYARQNKDYRQNLKDRIEKVSNSFFSTVQAIKDRYGTVSTGAVTALSEAAMNYQNTVHQQQMAYENNNRQNHATYNAMKDQIMQEDLFFREQQQYEIQDAVNNSLNTTYGEVLNQVKNGTYTAEMGRKVMNGMHQSIVNKLEEIAPGASGIFSEQVQQLLTSGSTPAAILNEIMTGEEFAKYAPVQSLGGTKYRPFGGDIVDSSTGSSVSPTPVDTKVSSNVKATEEGVNNSTSSTGFDWLSAVNTRHNHEEPDWDFDIVGEKTMNMPFSGIITSIERGGVTAKDGVTELASINAENGEENVRMRVRTDGGYIVEFNHLSTDMLDNAENLVGEQVERGDEIIKNGKTGVFQASPGGDGYHGDIRVKNPDGTMMNGVEVKDFVMKNLNYGFYSAGAIGKLGVPVDYERGIKGMVTATLMNSEYELKALEGTIKDMAAQGINKADAALTFMGFGTDLLKGDTGDLTHGLVNTVRSLRGETDKSFLATMDALIRAGDNTSVVEKVEGEAYAQIKEQVGEENFIAENKAANAIQHMQRIKVMLAELEKKRVDEELDIEALGAVPGTIQTWLGRFKDTAAQDLATEVKFLVGTDLVKLIGADMTDNEVEFFDDIIPKIGDSIENFNIKINSTESKTLREINNLRKRYLPELSLSDLEEGYDLGDRAKYYQAEGAIFNSKQTQEDLYTNRDEFSKSPENDPGEINFTPENYESDDLYNLYQ